MFSKKSRSARSIYAHEESASWADNGPKPVSRYVLRTWIGLGLQIRESEFGQSDLRLPRLITRIPTHNPRSQSDSRPQYVVWQGRNAGGMTTRVTNHIHSIKKKEKLSTDGQIESEGLEDCREATAPIACGGRCGIKSRAFGGRLARVRMCVCVCAWPSRGVRVVREVSVRREDEKMRSRARLPGESGINPREMQEEREGAMSAPAARRGEREAAW